MDALGHKQPQNLDMEIVVLGALMNEQDAFGQVAEILKPECFYDHRNQLVFEAIRDLAIQQKPVDVITVVEQLEAKGNLTEIGGMAYIAQLSGAVISSAHLEYHARIILQKYIARQLIMYASRIQQMAFDPGTDMEDLMQEAQGRLFELSQNNSKKDYTQINPVIQEAYEMLQIAAARTDGLSGLTSGFARLDKITSGWQASDLIIIAARPAMGDRKSVV